MTHSFDFGGVSEKLFILQQLQEASRDYCRHTGICKESYPYGHDDWNDYAHKIKRIVCGNLIEIAAKVRLLQDSTEGKVKPSIFDQAEEYATEDIPIGIVRLGDFVLTLRESCNKIIHATQVNFVWVTRNERSDKAYTYWTGKVELVGKRANKPWKLELDVSAWSVAVETFVDHVLSHVDALDLS